MSGDRETTTRHAGGDVSAEITKKKRAARKRGAGGHLCCWHSTGVGWRQGDTCGERRQCCHCGIVRDHIYRDVDVRMPGHGPFVRTTERRYEGLK